MSFVTMEPEIPCQICGETEKITFILQFMTEDEIRDIPNYKYTCDNCKKINLKTLVQ